MSNQTGDNSVPRRRFFQRLSLVLSGLYVILVSIPGVGLLIEPLRRQSKQGKRRRLLKLADLEVGVPRKVVITDRRVDAWTRYPEGSIGAVWMVRRNNDQVDVFSVTCPHLGCPVDHLAAEKKFFCPCHEGTYAEDGEILEGPQQRGLDRLDARLDDVAGEKWVSVLYQRFELGTPETIPLG